jgi:hypothetical protein
MKQRGAEANSSTTSCKFLKIIIDVSSGVSETLDNAGVDAVVR